MNTNSAKSRTIDLGSDLLTPADALDCLIGPINVILPSPNVTACNNLNEYFAKSTAGLHKAQSSGLESSTSKNLKDSKSKFSQQPFAVPLVRNFDRILKKNDNEECQPGTKTVSSQQKKVKQDVFTKTEKSASTLGPLLLLRERLDKPVKVIVRRRRKVPYISRVIEYKGTLILFDKHMNVYLKDVIESFKYSLGGQILKRARHRDDTLIRGDNVILIN